MNNYNLIETEYKKNIKALKSYLFRLTADRDACEDIAHDTFIKAIEKQNTFKGKSSFKTWIFSIATNIALDQLRKKKRWEVDAQDKARSYGLETPGMKERFIKEHSSNGNTQYEVLEHIDFCFTCISKSLPIEEQISLILKDIYNFKVDEIAEMLKISSGIVKHHLINSHNKMRTTYENKCALINKKGVCYQCSELGELFNGKTKTSKEILSNPLKKKSKSLSCKNLYKLRTQLIRSIDPLNSNGSDLHQFIMRVTRKAIGEIETI